MSIIHRSKDTGCQVIDVDLGILTMIVDSCTNRVKYKLGAKPDIHGGLDFTESDCSGFIRYLIYKATNEQVLLPDGSWNQRQWFTNRNFKRTSYVLNANCKDNRLRIAAIDPTGEHGHVWCCLNGKTIECYSGKGVGSRRWNNKTLYNRVNHCYVLTDSLS
jgi:hypothetical protein